MMATNKGQPGQMDPRRLALNAALMLAAFALAVGVAGAVFEPHIAAGSERIGHTLGAKGMLAFVFLADAIVSPLSPDLLLVVIAHGPLAESSHWLVPALGLMSMLGGLAGALLVRRLGTRLLGRWALKLIERHRPLVDRYGVWAVVLGALTPVPFSVTCWLAGLGQVRFGSLAVACSLRIPRFILYYVVIVNAGSAGGWLLG